MPLFNGNLNLGGNPQSMQRAVNDLPGRIAFGGASGGGRNARMICCQRDLRMLCQPCGHGDEIVQREGLVNRAQAMEAIRPRGADGEAEVDL
jgi:hypothetical protein